MLYYQYLHRKSLLQDFIYLVIFNVCMFIVFSYFDVLEYFYQLSRHYEQYDLDEFICLGASLTTSLLVFTYRRMSELGHITHAFEELAMRDPLTNLLNRRSGQLTLKACHQSAQTEEKTYTLLQVNINNFKRINQLYGTSVGDEVLIKTADELQHFLPQQSKTIRWLDDNFLIILPEQSQTVFEFAHQLRTTLSEKVLPLSDPIDFSIGIALFSPNYSAEQMLEHVEEALFDAKQNKENPIFAV